MRDDERGHAIVVQRADEFVHAYGRLFVESGGWLVHDEYVWIAGDHTGDGHETLLASGQIERGAILQMFDMQEPQGLLDPLLNLCLAQVLIAWAVGDVIGDGFGE